MANHNIRNQAPWPEDFDVALNIRQKAQENKPHARCLWRQRLVLVAKVLAIGLFIFVLFILFFQAAALTIASTIRAHEPTTCSVSSGSKASADRMLS